MKKSTRNLLIGFGAAAAAGLSLFGARKINEQLCKRENEKVRIKEVTDIGHLNEVEMEVFRIRTKPAVMIKTDGSVFLFLDRIDHKKETMMEIEGFLNERGVRKDAFKGIIAATYVKPETEIYTEENPLLVEMNENSVLYNKPVFLTSDAKTVDFGIPIKVGRSVMIAAGIAVTGPMAFPVAIGGKQVKQGLVLNVRDKGMVLLISDGGKQLLSMVQQMFSFTNTFHSVIMLHDEGGDFGFFKRNIKKSADFVNAGLQNVKKAFGQPIMDGTMKAETELLKEVIEHGVVLCGNHGHTATLEYEELFGEESRIVKFGESFTIE